MKHGKNSLALMLLVLGILLSFDLAPRRIRASSGSVSALNQAACVTPPPGLLAWWPGDGNANDIIGGNQGTLQNGATFAPGLVGQAFSLNQPGPVPFECPLCAFVSVANHFPASVDEVTVEAWIYPTENPELPQVQWIYTQYPTGPQLGFGGPGFIFWRPNVDSGVFDIPGSLPLNTWSHLAGTYNAATGLSHLYLNGELAGTDTYSGPVSLTATPFIGKRLQQEFYVGLIDELSVYTRELSASEIRSIFNAGASGKCKVIFDVCLTDDTTGNLFQFNSMTGAYMYTRCKDGFALSGQGVVGKTDSIDTLVDTRTDRRVNAGFNTGTLTGSATIQLEIAQGVWQDFRVSDTTSLGKVCSCVGN